MIQSQASIPAYTSERKRTRPHAHERTCAKGLSDVPYLKLSHSGRSESQPSTLAQKSTFKPQKHLADIAGIEVYGLSVIVKRHSTIKKPAKFERGNITELSAKSLARLAFVAFNTQADFRSMVTLTYPAEYSNDGRAVKADLNAFLVWHRKLFPGEKYLWFLEFQERGAPHFHVLSTVDLVSHGKLSTITRNSGKQWQTRWETWQRLESYWKQRGGGDTSWEVMQEKDGGKRYAAKYATKAYQKRVPEAYQNVGRFWGYSREGVKPDPEGIYLCDETMLREALIKGGWEYLPGEGQTVWRELYQAADRLDIDSLAECKTIEPLTNDQLIYAFTGQVPKLVIRDDQQSPPRLEYRCLACGATQDRWHGQCPHCNQWHTIMGFPQQERSEEDAQRNNGKHLHPQEAAQEKSAASGPARACGSHPAGELRRSPIALRT